MFIGGCSGIELTGPAQCNMEEFRMSLGLRGTHRAVRCILRVREG